MRLRPLLLAFALLTASATSVLAQSDRLDLKAFQQRLAQPGVQLVDVRTPEEFAKGHLEGAMNIDWLADDFMEKAGKLDKSKPVLLYCAAGGRSEEALAAMKKAGYTRSVDLLGGFNGWKKAGAPVSTK